jgi:hypothetical protein
VRYVAGQSIDYLTLQADRAVANKLEAIITHNAKSPDREKAAGDAPPEARAVPNPGARLAGTTRRCTTGIRCLDLP